MIINPLRAASALLAVAAVVASAPAAGATSRPAGSTTAAIRLAHLSPTTTPMDVYVAPFDGKDSILLRDIGYGAVSDYVGAVPGSYVFSWRPRGASPQTPAALTMSAVLEAGSAYTVAGLGADDDVRSVLITDDLTPPARGGARVRFINADESAGAVDLTVSGGAPLVRDADFATVTDYAAVPSGPWTLDVVTKDAPDGAEMSVTLQAGSVNTLLLLDTESPAGDLTAVVDSPGVTMLSGAAAMSLVSDAAGAPAAPVIGGVDTGFGATAATEPSPLAMLSVAWITGALVVATAIALLVMRRPSRGARHLRRVH